MRYSVLEKNLMSKIHDHLIDVAPGVMVRSYQNGRLICDIAVGTTYPYYDFASLTKIIFTIQMVQVGFQEGKVILDNPVQVYLPWFHDDTVLVRDLLNHTSGLAWWKPFYKTIADAPSDQRKEELKKLLIKEVITRDKSKSVYSDLDFFILLFVLEEAFQKSIEDIWIDCYRIFYEGTTLNFHLQNKKIYRKELYAPTEECPWRKRLIQGEVHDENAWSLGGLSTHAGLFGSIDDLSWYGLLLRSQLLGIARCQIKQKTAQFFAQRSMPTEMGDWSLGYMMPTQGSSSSGQFLSPQSIGHTGFTGTSIWYDSKRDLSIMILSNRVLYGRENDRFKKLRPLIHDWLIEGLKKSSII